MVICLSMSLIVTQKMAPRNPKTEIFFREIGESHPFLSAQGGQIDGQRAQKPIFTSPPFSPPPLTAFSVYDIL